MKPRLQDVLETIKHGVAAACNDAGVTIPGQVSLGQPIATELVTILGQRNEQVLLTVNERPGASRNVTRYPSNTWYTINTPFVPLNALILEAVLGDPFTGISFTGSVTPGLNIHTFIGFPVQDAHYQTVFGDTIASVASAVANAINALSIGGISAVASNENVVVTGTNVILYCNIGGQSARAQVVGQDDAVILVSLWTPNSTATQSDIVQIPVTRWQISDAISSRMGTSVDSWLYLSDGSPIKMERMTEWVDDQSQTLYSLYLYTMAFYVEYMIVKVYDSAQIESVESTTTIIPGTPITTVIDSVSVSGGP